MLLREEPLPYTITDKLKILGVVHWRGLISILAPIVLLPMVLPSPAMPRQWCGYTFLLMMIYWFTGCMPMAVTCFIPLIIFPIFDVMTTREICSYYINNTILTFLASLMIAFAVEHSGLGRRIALNLIKILGDSHTKLLLGIGFGTAFISMWITNTAATALMIPIIFVVLRVFEEQGVSKTYEYSKGEKYASDITTCYFCMASFSATIGGVGTLIGTGTNLLFRGLYQEEKEGKDEITFGQYSSFAIPLIIVCELFIFLILAATFCGLFEKKKADAPKSQMPPKAKQALQKAIKDEISKMGRMTFWESMVLVFVILAMLGLFLRSPILFGGWGEQIAKYFNIDDKSFVRDSAIAALIAFLMFLLPGVFIIRKTLKVKHRKDLPKGPATSILDWTALNNAIPYSFLFLMSAGFAMAHAANATGLSDKIGESLQFLQDMPNLAILLLLIVVTTLVTNIGSNVAIANIFVPVSMYMAKRIDKNQLWYALTTGVSASYGFLLPAANPGNMLIQNVANIRTRAMVKAGIGPTISTIIITWLFLAFYAPVIFTELKPPPPPVSTGAPETEEGDGDRY